MMNATIRRGCRCLPFMWTGIALVGAAEPGPGLTAERAANLVADGDAALTEYLGGMLLLNGLVEVSDESADALASCAAKVELRNLTTCSAEARKALADHLQPDEGAAYVICTPRLTADVVPLVAAAAPAR